MNTKMQTQTPVTRTIMGFPVEIGDDPQVLWQDAVAAVEPGPRTLYVHLPYCTHRCLFCPFYFGQTDDAGMKEYLSLLHRDLETAADSRLVEYPVNAVYFGGGTPTDLSAGQLAALLDLIRSRFKLTNDCEITVESRITGFSADKMQACVDHGANRFSLGVQTFNTRLRHMLGRIADRDEVIAALNRLTSHNQAAVVIDLLYGLPGQTMDDWIEDQRIVFNETELSGLDHYRLNTHSGLPMDLAIKAGKLPPVPDRDTVYAMYRKGQEIMEAAGAVRLSIKHYALQYRERNANNDVSSWKNPCYPFGIHAGGRLGGYVFRQAETIERYRELVNRGEKPLEYAGQMPPEFKVCGILSGQIGRNRGINIERAAAYDPSHSDAIIETCKPLFEEWERKGLLLPSLMGWRRMSPEAMFDHRVYSRQLMKTVGEAYGRKSC